MSYRVEHQNNVYHIIEKATEQTVASYQSSREARRVCRSLNLGSGFSGFTPTFFCEWVAQVKKKGD
jgi:hypothetical protein